MWGAVLASTLTTIAVFVPVIFMKEEVGQLFGDIALAISCAVALSLIVSITVIPSLSAKILRGTDPAIEDKGGFRTSGGWRPASGDASTWVVAGTVYRMTGSTAARLAVVVGFTAALSIGSYS